ncbi:MAG: DEAD/DEAH box helicase family protein, partial [Bdellovibrionota bacterium]
DRVLVDTFANEKDPKKRSVHQKHFESFGLERREDLEVQDNVLAMQTDVATIRQKLQEKIENSSDASGLKAFRESSPMLFNYVPVVDPELKKLLKGREFHFRSLPILAAGFKGVPFYLTESEDFKAYRDFLERQIMPDHSFDQFRRVGLGRAAEALAEDAQSPQAQGWMGRRGLLDPRDQLRVLEERARLTNLSKVEREALWAEIQSRYEAQMRLGYADARLDPDYFESIDELRQRVLENPRAYLADLEASIDYALRHRGEAYEASLMSALREMSIYLLELEEIESSAKKESSPDNSESNNRLSPQALEELLLEQKAQRLEIEALTKKDHMAHLIQKVLQGLKNTPVRDQEQWQSLRDELFEDSSEAKAQDSATTYRERLGLRDRAGQIRKRAERAMGLQDFKEEKEVKKWSEIPKDLREAMQQVFQIEGLKISEAEKEDFKEKEGRDWDFSEARMAFGRIDDQRVLKIQYFDPNQASSRGEMLIYIDRKAHDKFESHALIDRVSRMAMSVNGVHFLPADFSQRREIDLGDVREDVSAISDRLRLAVNDQVYLNPWLRRDRGQRFILSKPQQAAYDYLEALKAERRLGRGALIQMPGGMGKTELMIEFHRRAWGEKPPRLLWVVPSKDLPQQTKERFENHGLKERTRLVWTGDSKPSEEDLEGVEELFVSLDSAKANPELLRSWVQGLGDEEVLVVWDEAHHIPAAKTKTLFDELKTMSAKMSVVGLTATPFHYLEARLMDQFDKQVHYALLEADEVNEQTALPRVSFWEQLKRAAHRGYIRLPLLYAKQEALWRDIAQESEYSSEQLEALRDVVGEVQSRAGTLVYHPGGNETYRARQFAEYTESLALNSASSEEERERGAKALAEGEVLNLTNLWEEGRDLRGVGAMIWAASTESERLVLQRMFRSLRLQPGASTASIVDMTGENFLVLMREIEALYGEKTETRDEGAQKRAYEVLKEQSYQRG